MDDAAPVQDTKVSVGGADVKGCVHAGVASDLREEVIEKDASTKTMAALALDMDGAAPV